MEDDKQFMKYLSSQSLSWLDDLDQDFIFKDTESLLTVKMDQGDITGQPNVDNTLQNDPNMPNFDYSNRMIQFGVNDTALTGAMSTAQPTVIPDSYNYNNFLPSDGFYTDPSLSQSHIPSKSSQQPYSVDVNNTVHSEESYSNTSESQLCIDISGNSTNLNITQESNQYTLPNDVNIKDGFFHEEKQFMSGDYASGQLPMNAISHDANVSINNDFSQINNGNELKYSDTAAAAINIDHGNVHDKHFVDIASNLSEDSKPTNVEAPIEVRNDFEENTKSESTTEIKQELKHEEVDLDSTQVQMTTPATVQSSFDVVKDEKPVTQSIKVENQNLSDSVDHPVANGVDKTNTEDDLCDIQMCIRNGCANRAINNPEWEQEFCSNECVIMHCRNVFTSWVKTNEITT